MVREGEVKNSMSMSTKCRRLGKSCVNGNRQNGEQRRNTLSAILICFDAQQFVD